jgi:hypothetical protein
VAIASFSTPQEAHVARASLGSHGIEAVVDQDHTPFVGAASWVQLRVKPEDAALAKQILEEGPIDEEDGIAGTDGDEASTVVPADDMRPSRLSRRMLLARWFLYAQAIAILFTGFSFPIAFPLALVPLGLALWSKREPRPAFTAALVLQTLATLVSVAVSGPTGLIALIPNLAVYFAWMAAGEEPPDHLLATPDATRSVEDEIGEAWKEAGAPREVTSGLTVRWKRTLWVALAGVAVVVGGALLAHSPLVQRLLRGSTEFQLRADTEAALRQELELGRARLAMELRRAGIPFESIEISGLGAPLAMKITGIPLGATEVRERIIPRLFPRWTIDDDLSSDLRVTPGAEVRNEIIDAALRETLADLLGQYAVTVSDTDRREDGSIDLHAKIPGTRTVEEIRDLLVAPASLEIKRVRYPPGVLDAANWFPPEDREALIQSFGGRLPAGTELVVQPLTLEIDLFWPVESVPIIVGRDLAYVVASRDVWGDPTIKFELTEDGGRRLEAATSQMIGRQMALILRDESGARIISAPIIEGVIRTEGVIRGGFSEADARSLCAQMRAGARAMPLQVIGPLDEPAH